MTGSGGVGRVEKAGRTPQQGSSRDPEGGQRQTRPAPAKASAHRCQRNQETGKRPRDVVQRKAAGDQQGRWGRRRNIKQARGQTEGPTRPKHIGPASNPERLLEEIPQSPQRPQGQGESFQRQRRAHGRDPRGCSASGPQGLVSQKGHKARAVPQPHHLRPQG